MDIVVQDDDRVRHVLLNRAAKRNALTLQMCKDIVAAVREGESRKDIGCTLISANGSVFCAGMDLHETAPVDELTQAHEELFTLGAQALKPIIVAVNGAALAGGFGLAVQGHIVLASETATFGLPEVRIGFWPFVVYRAIEAALGKRRALEVGLIGTPFEAQQAVAWGLVQRLHSNAELPLAALKMAREIAKASPLAVSLGMQYVRETDGKTAREAGQIAAVLRKKLMASDDFKEGTAAFKEKREPRWPSSS
jgi:enoyl-CoA hydratase/carnithine racemase